MSCMKNIMTYCSSFLWTINSSENWQFQQVLSSFCYNWRKVYMECQFLVNGSSFMWYQLVKSEKNCWILWRSLYICLHWSSLIESGGDGLHFITDLEVLMMSWLDSDSIIKFCCVHFGTTSHISVWHSFLTVSFLKLWFWNVAFFTFTFVLVRKNH